MSIHVMNLVWKKAACSGNALLALLALADWSDDDGKSWPSICTLAKKSRQSERNCRSVVRWLESKNIISVQEREGNSNLFTINIESLGELGGQILPPAKISKRGGLREKSLPPSGANTAPNTSIYTSEEQEHTSNSSLEDFSLDSDEPEVKEKSKVVSKKPCDPRLGDVTAKIFEAYKHTNKVNPAWGKAEGQLLKSFLASRPDWPLEKIFDCIRNRWKSETNLAQEPKRWISKLGDYAGGPLNKFGQPRDNGNAPQSHTNALGATVKVQSMYPSPEDNERAKREADEKCRQRREARGM